MRTKYITNWKREKVFCNLFTMCLLFISVLLMVYILFTSTDIKSRSIQIEQQQKEREEHSIEYNNHMEQSTKDLESFKYITPTPEAVQANIANISVEDKYNYAMYDTVGVRNDLTVDLLSLGDQLMSENNLDPNLLFGIIMVESEGHADRTNPTSGAAGLGQFMPETGKFVYNTYINKNDEYYHNTTPYNATINLKMTVSYLDYLYDLYRGDTMSVLKQYCGGDDTFTQEYYNKVCNVVGYCIN